MAKLTKDIGKLALGNSSGTGASQAQIKNVEDKMVSQIESGLNQDTLSSGNILQRTWSGLKEGYQAADENAKALGPKKPPSLKKQLLETLFPPLQMLDPQKRAYVNYVGVPLSRATSAIFDPITSVGMAASQKALQTATKPLQNVLNKTLFSGKKGEERRQAWGDAMVAPAKKAIEEYKKLSPEDQAKLKNIALFAESLSAFSTLPLAGKVAGAGKEAFLAGVSKVPGAKSISNVLKGSAEKNLTAILNPGKVKTSNIPNRVKGIVSSQLEGSQRLPLSLTREGLKKKLVPLVGESGAAIKKWDATHTPVGVTKQKTLLDWLQKEKLKGLADTGKTSLNEMKGGTTKKGLSEFLDNPDITPDEKAAATRVIGGKYYNVTDQVRVKAIEKMEYMVKQYGGNIKNKYLQELKESLGKAVNTKGGWDKATQEGADLQLKKDFYEVVRDEIAKANPDLDALNQKFAFYKGAQEILDEVSGRRTLKETLQSVIYPGASIGGLLLAPPSTAATVAAMGIGGSIALLKSSGWKFVSSGLKARLAKAMVSGDKAAIAKVLQEINKEMGVAAAVGATGVQIPQSIEKATDLQKLKGTKFYEEQKKKGVPLYE